jgi:hypothetical protein
MTDKTDPSTNKPRSQPLPYIPVNPAKIMLAEGVAQIWHDTGLVGSMFKVALHTWLNGPSEQKPIQRLIGPQSLADLSDVGVIVEDNGLFSIPWVEEARTESDRRRLANVEKGRKGATVRWEKPKDSPAIAEHCLDVADDASKESKESTSSSSPKKRGRKPLPINTLWAGLWLEYRGQAWAWKGKDAIIMSSILKMAGGDLAEVERRARLMFSSKDLWTQKHADCGLLLSRWNQFGVEIVPVSSVTAALCGGSAAAQDLYTRLKGVVGAD